jgi:hypothetical protein
MKHKGIGIVVVLLALSVGIPTVLAATGQTLKANAALTPKQEVPPQKNKVTDASGTFTGTLTKTKKGYQLSWQLTFKSLSGPAKSGYIHRGKLGKHGAALFALCSPCSSGAHGKAYASPWEVGLMSNGQTYVTVRTKKNPAGEIRGQIKVS